MRMPAASQSGRRRRLLLAIWIAAVLALLLASVAHAADRIYWGNYDDPANALSYANLDGSGGADLPTPGVPKDGPQGFSLNPSTGTLYFANYGEDPNGAGEGQGTSLGFARLDGSGGGIVGTPAGTVHGPHGTAIDPGAGRIYWPNETPGRIRFANLDGTGEGDLNTGTATVDEPRGVALDLAGGRIYWANHGGDFAISYANLDGSGGANLNTGSAPLNHSEGVAIAGGRIYWGSLCGNGVISYANLDGSGGGVLPTAGTDSSCPHGVAIDPSTQTIYWVNYATPGGSIDFARLDGSGGGMIPTGNATTNGMALPMLLEQPAAQKTPKLTGSPKPGSKLTCAQATWKGDEIAAQLYQSPQSVAHRWLRNGKPVKGETGNTLKVHDVAEYSCLDSATNAAGTTSKASDPIGVFKIGSLRRNLTTGTARLVVKVPASGVVKLSGKGLAKKRNAAGRPSSHGLERKVKGGRVKLTIKPKGKLKRRLFRTGKAKVKIRVSYRPSDGVKGTQRKALKLEED
jgi:hypothetical protein